MIFLTLFYCFLILTVNASVRSSSPPRGHFTDLSADVLRTISEYLDILDVSLRSINKFTWQSVPSLQQRLAQKFSCKLLKNLPSTPELFHFINFRHDLDKMVYDSTRLLKHSLPIISEATILNVLKSSHDDLNPELLKKTIMMAIHTENPQLFVKLLESVSITSLENIPESYLLESFKLFSQSITTLGIDLRHLVNEENAKYFAFALFLSDFSLNEILSKLEKHTMDSFEITEALLQAITASNSDQLNRDKFIGIIYHLSAELDFSSYNIILELFILMKFDPKLLQTDFYKCILNQLSMNERWKYLFIKVSIEVGRFDICKETIESLESIQSLEIQELLLRNPHVLDGIDQSKLILLLNDKYLDYRIITDPQDFDINKEVTSSDDAIVSAYIHSNERFMEVLDRLKLHDYVEWASVLDKCLNDMTLIEKLKILAESLQILPPLSDCIYSQISFPVLKVILLNLDKYLCVFSHKLNFKLMFSSEVMAEVLRDTELYIIFRDNHGILFPRIFFSFSEAIKKFTLFDWERLFALSKYPFIFEGQYDCYTLNVANCPSNQVTLNFSIDIYKTNIKSFMFIDGPEKIRKRKMILYEPLMQLWEKYDLVGFKKNFPIDC